MDDDCGLKEFMNRKCVRKKIYNNRIQSYFYSGKNISSVFVDTFFT
jgi:hypothetical protein